MSAPTVLEAAFTAAGNWAAALLSDATVFVLDLDPRSRPSGAPCPPCQRAHP
jgi:hypothetical protein